jgi:Tfp pilus assembly protein PilO
MSKSKLLVTLGEAPWSRVILVGVLFACLYYLAAFDDGVSLRARQQAAQQQLDEAKKKLAETKQALKDAEQFEKDVKLQEAKFQKVTEFMPASIDSAELTIIVNSQAAKSGAKVTKIEPREGDQKGDFYETRRVRLSLQGTFVQIMGFLSNMTKVPKLLTFDDLELALLPGNDPEQPKISCTGTLVAYRYKAAPGGAANAPK